MTTVARPLPLKARAGRVFVAAIKAFAAGDGRSAYRQMHALSRTDLEMYAAFLCSMYAHCMDDACALAGLVAQMQAALDTHGDEWERHFFESLEI